MNMFEALSKTKNAIIAAKDVYDVNEIFKCPNPNCPAELKLRSVNGKRAKHFFCGKNMLKHSADCPFSLSLVSIPTELVEKNTLEEIFKNAQIKDMSCQNTLSQEKNTAISNAPRAYVRTPKQLLQFCLGHALETEYTDNLMVDDIIVDSRNLQANGKFKGVSGLRLIVGETIKFDNPTLSILFKVSSISTTGKPLMLYCTVFTSKELLNKVANHYNNTYGKFGRHSIAVLGKWEIDSNYHISCLVERDRNLIMVFK